MEDRLLPERLSHAIVVVSVLCRRCEYDLRGQSVSGRCPECGASVYESVCQTLDPAASRLPTLRDPIGVGYGLVWLVGCWLLCLIATRLGPLAAWLEGLDVTAIGRIVGLLPAWIGVLAPAFMLMSLYGVQRLAPPRDAVESGAVRNDLRLMQTAILLAAAALTVLSWPGLAARTAESAVWLLVLGVIPQLGLATATFLGLIALRNVLRVVGQRSRTYRTARGGKQGLNGLAAAALCIAVGRMLEYTTPGTLLIGRSWREWQGFGTVVVTVGYLMLLIGFLYLFVNMWWIRGALRVRPPTLDEILLPPLPADTTILGPDDEEPSFEVKAKGEP